MSSLYNNSEYNNLLFAGSSPTDAPFSDPPEYISLSSTINGTSDLSILIAGEIPLSVFIADSSSGRELLRLTVMPGLSETVIQGSSEITSEMTRIRGLSSSISCSSIVKGGTLFRIHMSGVTVVSSTLHVDYGMSAGIFSGISECTTTLKYDSVMSVDIDSICTVDPVLRITKTFSAGIINSSVASADTLDIFIRLQTEETSIIGSSVFTSEISFTSNISATSTGSSTVNSSLSNLTNFSDVTINGLSDFKSVKKLGATDFDGGLTRIVANLDAPASLSSLGSRRRVSYVFEVDIPRTNVSLIDQHYKIFRFYNSMSSLGPTLEYVRRNATRELDSYDVDSTSHRKWTSDADLNEIKTGDRGIVQKNPRDTFAGKEGYFGLYKGPNKP